MTKQAHGTTEASRQTQGGELRDFPPYRINQGSEEGRILSGQESFGTSSGVADARTAKLMSEEDPILTAAMSAPKKDRSLIGPILPAAMALIAKGYTHREVYDFLKEHGANVPESFANFSSAPAKRTKRVRIQLIEKATK